MTVVLPQDLFQEKHFVSSDGLARWERLADALPQTAARIKFGETSGTPPCQFEPRAAKLKGILVPYAWQVSMAIETEK